MIKAYSKINLGLEVDTTNFSYTNKHKIKSLFCLYKDLYDEIDISISDKNHDLIIYENININDCLVQKTLNYLRSKNLIKNFFSINIKKQIPLNSGLGGGSSDAASIINYLVSDHKKLDMLDIALNLGSDIPFFLSGLEYAIVEGFGEKITSVNIKTNLNIFLIDSGCYFSTKEIFKLFLFDNQKTYFENDYNSFINNLNLNKIDLGIKNVFIDTVLKKSIK